MSHTRTARHAAKTRETDTAPVLRRRIRQLERENEQLTAAIERRFGPELDGDGWPELRFTVVEDTDYA